MDHEILLLCHPHYQLVLSLSLVCFLLCGQPLRLNYHDSLLSSFSSSSFSKPSKIDSWFEIENDNKLASAWVVQIDQHLPVMPCTDLCLTIQELCVVWVNSDTFFLGYIGHGDDRSSIYSNFQLDLPRHLS
jgi:hypothetical protein